ncbi:hypothetical protein D1B33_05250 [Lysinibacillus yapensis]|uniref:Uncharacterized protein n=1 Tax=Ureibacillus yapensis TaxID=2304605 RepID=A0A396SHV1_9BACL|nr:hypothetical protein [Lysinibacillus yapensis]RHW38295.1 hypothetical protein D1B33_05250 [Lysinibacillus yapensis]
MGLDCNSNKEKKNAEHNRIESNVIFENNSLIISQSFCVNATVGGDQNLVVEEKPLFHSDQQPFNTEDSSAFLDESLLPTEKSSPQDYTLIYAAPALPILAPLLITVIARNLSDNDVLISIEDDEEVLVEEIVPANSELALTAQNALFVRALALSQSKLQFFINVYHPTNLYR